jgi:DNA-binding NarL/FixJ family response regulator
MALRVVLVDDHDLVRGGIRSLLESRLSHSVVGEASDGRHAISVVDEMIPDLVIMDINMPGLNGIDATRQITSNHPGRVKVCVLSMHSDARTIGQVLKAGACGYILKNSAVSELDSALSTIEAGKVYLSPLIANVVVDSMRGNHADLAANRTVFDVLTNAERGVLQLVAEGKTSKEIGGIMKISSKTVDTYRARITAKLKINSVAELTKYAISEGLTTL